MKRIEKNPRSIVRRSASFILLMTTLQADAADLIIDISRPDDFISSSTGISANGKVVIGDVVNPQTYINEIFKYSENGDKIFLGTLGGDSSHLTGISADGSVIAGVSGTAGNAELHAYKYTDSAGMVDLGTLGGSVSMVNALSADGSTIVGWSYVSRQSGIYHAFKHTDQGGMVDLGTLGGLGSVANAVSADGSVVVGYSDLADTSRHAFKYTDSNGMLDLGTLGGETSFAFDISADGSVVVGNSSLTNGEIRAFKHTEDGGMVSLGTLGRESSVTRVSSDGSIVIGNSVIPGNDYYYHAFKHSDATGMVDLGTLGGNDSYAAALSADGSVVVGSSSLANGELHAYKHTDETGMVDLGTLGGSASAAYAVSADGKIIVGGANTVNGDWHAVLWTERLIVDSTNTRAALAQTAQQATQVLDMRSAQLQMLMQQDCSVGAGNGRFCIGAAAAYTGAGKARSTAASFTLGYQVAPQWRIGTTINQSLDSSLPSEYKSSSKLPGIGVFTTFNARKDGLGWQARVAAAYQTSKVDINRKQLAYTEGGIGRADLDGKAAAIEGSYRMLTKNGVVVAPYAALRYSSVNRSAYDESNDVTFVGRYGEMGRSATSIETGMRFGKAINSKLSLFADIGITHDVVVNDRGFSVAMDYVGGFNLGNSNDERTRAHLGLQGSYALAKDSAIQGGIYWGQQTYGNDSTSAQIILIRQF